ncbi:hypothetical protein SEPCBS57363_002491 [Sporothrix epigloea]|uniref:DDHD domain-containing protein n=1 Tax=Sporothrix epigloea TaxID=1892477 RepID=A0ABP0DHW2_9PEZI
MGPPAGDKKAEKPTLLSSMNPWASSGKAAAQMPIILEDKNKDKGSTTASSTSGKEFGATGSRPAIRNVSNVSDHITSSYYGRSFRSYPPGCPTLKVQWFHAVDSPKRKSQWMSKKASKDAKPLPPAKKYTPFAVEDNRSIEAAYQNELEVLEDKDQALLETRPRGRSASETVDASEAGTMRQLKGSGVKVPVNEDFLFDVDIDNRELAPVYWLGPIYDVRRGTWFYQEGSTLRSCDENLAAQLEEGYLKAKPWLYPVREKQTGESKDAATPQNSSEKSTATPSSSVVASVAAALTSATSGSSATGGDTPDKSKPRSSTTTTFQPESHRLFGQYMTHVATYQDATTAWLSTDGMLSWVTSTMYERFSGGGYMSGVKVVRGYTETKKARDDKPKDGAAKEEKKAIDDAEDKRLKALKRRSAPASTIIASNGGSAGDLTRWDTESHATTDKDKSDDRNEGKSDALQRRSTHLQRQLSTLMGSDGRSSEQEAEDLRRLAEEEIQDDYNAQKGETQGREIEHLVLVTHGIGQLLGLRMESLNFIHDVNMLRKTLKSVYSASPELRAINSELPEGPGNCRIQVLPVCWRHLLDFPRRKSVSKKLGQDLGVINDDEDEELYPALEDITIEGMAFARSLISDLALDILLYQSAYREEISEIVLSESNRIHNLFLERNPGFKGTVHVIGHSLGSAIMFDILCRQKEKQAAEETSSYADHNPLRICPPVSKAGKRQADFVDDDDVASLTDQKHLDFNFDVENLYCLGSPIGLFQMLKGRTIAARHQSKLPSEQQQPFGQDLLLSPDARFLSLADGDSSPYGFEFTGDKISTKPSNSESGERISSITGLPLSVSSPMVGQIFNIVHPSDPICYRLEPLIAPAMKTLKPQPLPYTKKGIFGSVAPQGLTNIGAKVGQSVSGMWSSLSAGIASNLLNRSLGLTQEDVAKLEEQQKQHTQQQEGMPADGNTSLLQPIVDEEVETLFSHFEKKRATMAKEEAKEAGRDNGDDAVGQRLREEAKAQRMRREEAKVRALNRNGRVDYSIQESVLDFNPINTIASHMSYWADEDVSHFIMSQAYAGKMRPSPPSAKKTRSRQ